MSFISVADLLHLFCRLASCAYKLLNVVRTGSLSEPHSDVCGPLLLYIMEGNGKGEEGGIALFKLLTRHLVRGTEEDHEIRKTNSKQALPGYKTGTLPIEPTYPVCFESCSDLNNPSFVLFPRNFVRLVKAVHIACDTCPSNSVIWIN